MSAQPPASPTPTSARERSPDLEAAGRTTHHPLPPLARSLARDDEIVEQTILTQALLHHPTKLAIMELAIKIESDCENFAGTDIVERAVRELSRDGLLQCDCRRVWPTTAALRFDALLGGGI